MLFAVSQRGAALFILPVIEILYAANGLRIAILAAPAARDVFDRSPVRCTVLDRCLTLGDRNGESDDILDDCNAIVVSCGATPAELGLVQKAVRIGMPCVQFIDTWYLYRHRLETDGAFVLADQVLVADGTAVEEAIAEGVPRGCLVAAGHPGWERIQPLSPIDSRRLLFLGAPVRRDFGEQLGYDEESAFKMVQKVAERRRDLIDGIAYAPHPLQGDFDPGDAHVVRYDPSLLETFGTIAGMFSAPLVDGYLAGRRVVTVQPNATALDMCPLSRHGRIPRSRTEEELIAALESPANDPAELRSALAGSAERVTNIVLEALHR